MQERIPLGRTYKYNSTNRVLKGYWYVQETVPLGRTYIYNSGNCL